LKRKEVCDLAEGLIGDVSDGPAHRFAREINAVPHEVPLVVVVKYLSVPDRRPESGREVWGPVEAPSLTANRLEAAPADQPSGAVPHRPAYGDIIAGH
jgi:hypothetical protein